jgi:hypothetical protein
MNEPGFAKYIFGRADPTCRRSPSTGGCKRAYSDPEIQRNSQVNPEERAEFSARTLD